MKKIFGLLATSSILMLAACSDDESNSVAPNSASSVTAETCAAVNMVLTTDPVSGVAYCASPALTQSSSSADLNGGLLPGSSQPDPTLSSSSTPVATVSSSSVAPTTPSSSSVAPAPTSTTPPAEDESDGTWHLALWDGTAGDPQVPTGNKSGGYWYSYTDSGDKGLSTLVWDAEDDGTSADGLVPVIKECQGLCGSFDLLVGSNPYKPYVGIGFNYSKSANEVADATASKGVCVTYTSDIAIILEMGLGAQDSKIGYANPFVTLPAATSPSTKDYNWSDFEQPTWASAAQTVTNPQQALASLKFKFAGAKDSVDGGSGKFKIMKVGAPGQCN
ncbi:MAG: hypothetical protein J5615_00320 [Fibrobacter sp.]|nr:hypothetical protein [Fibrobacter sp.]